jgi:hypothetical protein
MLRTDYGRGSRYVCTQCGNSVLVVPTQPATADEMSETRCNCTVHRHCVRCHGTDVVEGKVDVCVECGKEQPTPPAEGEMKTVARLAAIAAQVQAAPAEGENWFQRQKRSTAKDYAELPHYLKTAEGERRLPSTVSIVRREQGGVQIEGHTLAQDWEIEVDEHGTLLSMSLEAVPAKGETTRKELALVREAANDPNLSDTAVRVIARGLREPTADDIAWARKELSRRADGETAEGLSAEQQIARLTAERDRLRAALHRIYDDCIAQGEPAHD